MNARSAARQGCSTTRSRGPGRGGDRLLLASAVWLAAATASAQTVQVFQTNADQSKLLQQQASVSFGSSGTGSTTITVNTGTRYQQIDGFGASLTDSSAYLISRLPTANRTALMQALFSPTAGIGLSFLRQPMGATDFNSSGNFSFDDVPAGQTDPNLTAFTVAHDNAYVLPVVKQALSLNPSAKVMFLPWSPPAWMKTSGTMNGGSFNAAYWSALAQYFVKAIQAYQAAGVPISAVAMQNEPLNSTGSYPSMSVTSNDQAFFIGRYLGPALAAAGLGAVKILGYEHNWDNTSYPEQVLSDSTANPFVAGTSWHCYAGDVSAQTTVKNAYPSKDVWFTECSGGAWATDFGSNLGWNMQNLVIGGTRNWARAVSLWNIALDQNAGPTNGGCTNCRGVVTINTGSNAVAYNVEYYSLGHASKFVKPGAYRVDSNSAGAGGVQDVAFLNPDGSIALLVYNSAGGSSTFNVSQGGKVFSYTLPAGAVATFTWTPGSGGGGTTAPAAPTNLTASAPSASEIDLSWTASTTAGVTYSVFRSTASGFAPSSSNQVASGLTVTSYASTGLSASTTYYFVVQAVNAAGAASSSQASATTQASGSTSISTTAWYEVVSQLSGACVDAQNQGTGNGTPLQQWACGGTQNQMWQFRATSGGYYQIVERSAPTQAWDVTGGAGATANGTKLQLWAYGGGTNQQWQPVSVGTGLWKLVARNSGRCLDVTGASTANGALLQIWDCTGSPQQTFRLVQVP
jgi:glucosylceramidase